MVKSFEKLKQSTAAKILLLVLLVAGIMSFNFKVFTTHNSISYVDPNADIGTLSITRNQIEQHFFANEPVRAIELTLYQDKIQGPTRLAATLYNVDSDPPGRICLKKLSI